MVRGRANKIFAVLLVEIMLTMVFDIWSEAYTVCIPARESNTGIRTVLCFLYLYVTESKFTDLSIISICRYGHLAYFEKK